MKQLVKIVLLLLTTAFWGQDCSTKYGKVVISEVFFDTRFTEKIESKHHYGEFIELYNSSNTPIDLTSWVIKDNHTAFSLYPDNSTLGNTNFIIQPGGYKLIAYAGFHCFGGNGCRYAKVLNQGAPIDRAKIIEFFPELKSNPNFKPEDIILQDRIILYNKKDKVELFAPNGKCIDRLEYKNDKTTNILTVKGSNTPANNAVAASYLDNNDGGILIGPMAGIPRRNNPSDVFYGYQTDANGDRIYDIDDNLKKSIYRSNIDGYYANQETLFSVATASPFSSPNVTVPLLPLDPFMLLLSDSNNDNQTESLAYDIKTGAIIGQSKTYFDDLGKPRVAVSKDYQTGLTWGTETVYDDFGRKWKESFPTISCKEFDNINFLSDNKMKSLFLDKFYSNTNTLEKYQATAQQPYSEINYDNGLNPGAVINVVGGNKIVDASGTPQWKTGYSYTVPAAQEMYYAFGYDYFNNQLDPKDFFSQIIPPYTGNNVSVFVVKVINSPSDILAQNKLPLPGNPNVIMALGAQPIKIGTNLPLSLGKIYKVSDSNGVKMFVQICSDAMPVIPAYTTLILQTPITGPLDNFQEANSFDISLNNFNGSNNFPIILKSYKNIVVDANGVENVSFVDADGKNLAAARSGGNTQYPVTSLIGEQGFIDIHLPKGCQGTLSYIGGDALYNVYNLTTGALLTNTEKANITPGVYRVELINKSNLIPYTYIDKTTGTISPVSSLSKGVTYNVNYYDYTLNVYNKTGQLIKNIQPKGYQANTVIKDVPAHMLANAPFTSTYNYNSLGQLIEAKSPDEGTSRFAYRNDGQIRYSQSELQKDRRVSYTNYDELARPIESGVILDLNRSSTGIWNTVVSNPDGATPAGANYAYSEQTATIYDYIENNTTSITIPTNLSLANVLTTAGINPANYIQENLAGNVACTFSKTASTINAITWYNYDAYGRVVWVVQYTEGLGTKTIHYEYDYKGNVTKVLFQKDKVTEMFVHRYTYQDINNALTKVETATDNSNFITHAEYSYYVTGELKRTNIAQGAQGLDYVYTLGGQLKSINHPSLLQANDPGGDANDVFGLILDYHDGDYNRANTNISSSPTIAGTNQDFNGNIKAARWGNRSTIVGGAVTGTANTAAYTYNYNRNGWMQSATYGNFNSTGAITPNTQFAEKNLNYDANGNIQNLQRTNENGTLVDDFTYNYNNNNQLNSVTDGVDPGVTYDIDSQPANNYQYNAIGQLVRNNSENIDYFYNTQGLTTEVKQAGQTRVKFFYNERGQRVKKESYNGVSLQSTDYYALDISGNVMAIYTQLAGASIIQKELPIYGASRVGVYNKINSQSADYMSYQITDHLGNVRAIVKKLVNNPIVAIFTADYYPFGEKLPTKDTVTGQYRYAYQGQEVDPETGMEAFQLRLWDGRIGRWLNPDPYGQYASPYLGMGNNPVNRVDPDGGADGDPQIPPLLSGQQQPVRVYGPQPEGIGMSFQWPEIVVGATVSKPVSSGIYGWNDGSAERFWDEYAPISSSLHTFFEGAESGNKVQMATGVGFLAIDLVSFGEGSVWVKGAEEGFVATKGLTSPTGKFYSVAFETELASTSYPGVSRYMHFKEANVALDAAMGTNPMLGQLGISVPRSAAGSIIGKSPTNWVWHHNVNKGIMQLVPKAQHPNIPGGIFWETMHPGGVGGYYIWGK